MPPYFMPLHGLCKPTYNKQLGSCPSLLITEQLPLKVATVLRKGFFYIITDERNRHMEGKTVLTLRNIQYLKNYFFYNDITFKSLPIISNMDIYT